MRDMILRPILVSLGMISFVFDAILAAKIVFFQGALCLDLPSTKGSSLKQIIFLLMFHCNCVLFVVAFCQNYILIRWSGTLCQLCGGRSTKQTFPWSLDRLEQVNCVTSVVSRSNSTRLLFVATVKVHRMTPNSFFQIITYCICHI